MICAQFTYIFWFLGLKHIIVTYNQGGEIVDILAGKIRFYGHCILIGKTYFPRWSQHVGALQITHPDCLLHTCGPILTPRGLRI